jgi:hypothetical protein
LPNLTPHQHLQTLTNKLTQATTLTNQTTKGRQLIRYLGHQIEPLLNLTPILKEQRVVDEEQRVAEALQRQAQEEEQRVINNTPIITIPCITDIPTIMQTCNPTTKHVLKSTKCLHHCVTRNKTQGIMAVPSISQEWDTTVPSTLQHSTQTNMQTEMRPTGQHQAMNVLALQEQASFCMVHTPHALKKCAKMSIKFENYA